MDCCTSVIHTSCRGRTVVASRFIRAGSVVSIEDPVACVPIPESTLSGLACDSGRYSLTVDEKELKSSLNDARFSGNVCILASRFYLYGASDHIRPADIGTTFERYNLIRNHMNKDQSVSLMGMNECALLVQQLITRSLLRMANQSGASGKPSTEAIVSLDVCTEILCKLCCNLFTITSDFQNECGVGCYPRTALINHSCEPNCIQRFDNNANIIIRACVDIPKGQEVTISYIDTGMPTWHRQFELLKSYYFHCTCSRCTRVDSCDEYLCSTALCSPQTNVARKDASFTADFGINSAAYASWLNPISATVPVAIQMATPVLPFPMYPTIASPGKSSNSSSTTSTIACSHCHSSKNITEITAKINKITSMYDAQKILSNTPLYRSYTPAERLFAALTHYSLVLQQLHLMVPEYHYCILIVRKHLKIAFEEYLPVRDGVLLFPPLKVRASVRTEVLGACASRAGENNVHGGVKKKEVGSRLNEAVVLAHTASALQQMYEDNLAALLRCMPHCYSALVHNSCYIFYRIQYVWYLLSKPESLVTTWGGGSNSFGSSGTKVDRRADMDTIRKIVASSKDLMDSVQVVYGADHVFYADMQHCIMQLRSL